MKRTVSAKKSSRSSTAKTRPRGAFVLCVDNSTYEASLEVGKVYRSLPMRRGSPRGWLRVIEESGDDYLFAAKRFVPVAVPPRGRKAIVAMAG